MDSNIGRADAISSTGSITSDETSANIEDIVQEEPMYYVLGQFLTTSQGKSIADVLQELATEVRQLRLSITAKEK